MLNSQELRVYPRGRARRAGKKGGQEGGTRGARRGRRVEGVWIATFYALTDKL